MVRRSSINLDEILFERWTRIIARSSSSTFNVYTSNLVNDPTSFVQFRVTIKNSNETNKFYYFLSSSVCFTDYYFFIRTRPNDSKLNRYKNIAAFRENESFYVIIVIIVLLFLLSFILRASDRNGKDRKGLGGDTSFLSFSFL